MEYQDFVADVQSRYGVDRVWSFSQVNSFKQDPYGWYLHYILHEPSDKNTGNAYGVYGNMVHDIMEEYYKGNISREECVETFQTKWDELSLLGMKFNNIDEASDKKLKKKYYEDVLNFMETFTTIEGEHVCEKPMSVLLKSDTQKEAFVGYIDFLNHVGDKYQIIDYKTSTMYKGNAVEEHAKQLLLYAASIREETGCRCDQIEVGWNFLKYIWVKETQKNGNIKDRYIERCELGEKLSTSIKKWLKEYGYSESEADYVTATNDMSRLPEEVRDKFKFQDCIITVPYDETIEEVFIDNMLKECYNIREHIKEYESTNTDNMFMWEPEQRDEFYYYNLCDYSTKLHKPFANYFNAKEQPQENDDSEWLDKATENGSELDILFKNL